MVIKLSVCLVVFIIAERISARQYKSGSILGIYVRTYVRSSFFFYREKQSGDSK